MVRTSAGVTTMREQPRKRRKRRGRRIEKRGRGVGRKGRGGRGGGAGDGYMAEMFPPGGDVSFLRCYTPATLFPQCDLLEELISTSENCRDAATDVGMTFMSSSCQIMIQSKVGGLLGQSDVNWISKMLNMLTHI